MNRGDYPDHAFAYVRDNMKLLRHHTSEASGPDDHDTVDPGLLTFAIRAVDTIPIFEENADEIRQSISQHLEEHQRMLEQKMREAEQDWAERANDEQAVEVYDGIIKRDVMDYPDVGAMEVEEPEDPEHSPGGTTASKHSDKMKNKDKDKKKGKNKSKSVELPNEAFAYYSVQDDGILLCAPHHKKIVENPRENSSVDLSELRKCLANVGQVSDKEIRKEAVAHLMTHAKEIFQNDEITIKEAVAELDKVISFEFGNKNINRETKKRSVEDLLKDGKVVALPSDGTINGRRIIFDATKASAILDNETEADVEFMELTQAKIVEVRTEGTVEYVTVWMGDENMPWFFPFELHRNGDGELMGVMIGGLPVPADVIPDFVKFLRSLA